MNIELISSILLLMINFILLFFLIKEKKVKKTLLKTIEENKEKIESLKIKYENKLKNEIENSKNKDKIIYQQSKLTSMKELITNLAHQWRQPLSVISVAATSLELYEKSGELKKEDLLKNCILINENAQYLSQTIENFSDMVEKRRTKKIYRIEDAMDIIQKLTATFTGMSNINLILNIKDDISIYGYKYELIQILLNILTNSKEVFEIRDIKDRYIFLDINSDEKEFTINIKDTAGGIEEKNLNKVFEPYFTTKHQEVNTGLGLYISYLIIKNNLKGKIEASNEEFEYKNKNYKGASFFITLPRT